MVDPAGSVRDNIFTPLRRGNFLAPLGRGNILRRLVAATFCPYAAFADEDASTRRVSVIFLRAQPPERVG
jgi:hypothetical protein